MRVRKGGDLWSLLAVPHAALSVPANVGAAMFAILRLCPLKLKSRPRVNAWLPSMLQRLLKSAHHKRGGCEQPIGRRLIWLATCGTSLIHSLGLLAPRALETGTLRSSALTASGAIVRGSSGLRRMARFRAGISSIIGMRTRMMTGWKTFRWSRARSMLVFTARRSGCERSNFLEWRLGSVTARTEIVRSQSAERAHRSAPSLVA